MTLSRLRDPRTGIAAVLLLVFTSAAPLASAASASTNIRHTSSRNAAHRHHGRSSTHRRHHAARRRPVHRTTVHRHSSRAPHGLAIAARRARRADRELVTQAHMLRRCLAAQGVAANHCIGARAAVQHAGVAFRASQRRLSRIAGTSASVASDASVRSHHGLTQPPRLSVNGEALRWSRVAHASSYIVMRSVPGEGTTYELVHGQRLVPPPAPGAGVTFRVRTSTRESQWSPERTIQYAAAPAPAETPPQVDRQAAPVLEVSGETLTWGAVDGVSTYVLAARQANGSEHFTEVTGTSVTPSAVSGRTVSYQVRTAIDGSAWSRIARIAYPAATKSPASQQSSKGSTAEKASEETSPPVSGGGFEMGIVTGEAAIWELPWVTTLGARTARMEFEINDPVSQLEPVVEAYARVGVKPLLLATFTGRIPSSAEARNLGSWAAAFGDGGSFWASHPLLPRPAVTDIEFGNETSLTYQFSNNSPSAYVQRAEEYASRFAEAAAAIHSQDANVALLAQADSGGQGTEWLDGMFKAVPNLGSLVGGWITHEYSPEWETYMNRIVTETAAHGASSSIPIFVTEGGLATDNGRCLSENYGWNRCMSYSEAASTISKVITAMRARYGSRLRAYYLYQARDQDETGKSEDREGYFGALQSNMAPKGAYTTTVESLLGANP